MNELSTQVDLYTEVIREIDCHCRGASSDEWILLKSYGEARLKELLGGGFGVSVDLFTVSKYLLKLHGTDRSQLILNVMEPEKTTSAAECLSGRNFYYNGRFYC